MTPSLLHGGRYVLELMALSQLDGTLNLVVRSISDDLRELLGLPGSAQLTGRSASRLFAAESQIAEEWTTFLLKVIHGYADLADNPREEDSICETFLQFYQARRTWLHTHIAYHPGLHTVKIVFTDPRDSAPGSDAAQFMQLKQSLWLERFVSKGYSWEIDLASGQILLSARLARCLRLAGDMVVVPMQRFLATVHPEDLDAVTTALEQVEQAAAVVPSRAVLDDGSMLHFSSFAVPVYNRDGKMTQIVGRTQDVTEKEAAAIELQRSEQLFRGIVENTQDIIAVVNTEGILSYVSPNIKTIMGYPSEEVMGQPYHKFLEGPGGRSQFAGRVDAVLSGGEPDRGEYHIRREDGGYTYIQATFAPLYDENSRITGIVAVCRDITESKLRSARLRHMGLHDTLTGTLNRLSFENELKKIERDDIVDVGLVLCDFNGLKTINDALGHQRGDELLVEVAGLLNILAEGQHRIYRVGGDEFAIVLYDMKAEGLEAFCRRIDAACETSAQSAMPLSISWGSALRDQTALGTQALYKLAEGRMNAQKLLDNRSARSQVLTSLKEALKSRYVETSEHMQRMENMVMALGRRLGLPSDAFDQLVLLASMHDIGKISIPDDIINKPASLNETEWDIMRGHSQAGYRIAMTSRELSDIAEAICCHHERWDSKGYPFGREGEDIPLLSRIIGVVDAYDVMTHQRIYKKAVTHEEAIAELARCAGSQFDPQIVELFLDIFGSLSDEEMRRYTGGDPERQQGAEPREAAVAAITD